MASKQRVLLLGPLHGETQAALESSYLVARWWEFSGDEGRAYLSEHAKEIEVVATNYARGADVDIMRQLPALALVACFGVGVDSIDVPWCHARNIAVSNTPDVLTDDVADLAVGLMLTSLRQIVAADRFVRQGDWLTGPMPLQSAVRGRRVGIVGMGRIGQAIAARLVPFGAEVAYYGPHPKPVSHRYEDSVLGLATWADVLIAACPGGDATRGILSREVLTALGPRGHVINIARGSVVDQPALIALLASGALAGAALDVFDDEPRVPAALLAIDRVVVQPHHGSGTRETRGVMGQLLLANIAAHFAGNPLPSPVR